MLSQYVCLSITQYFAVIAKFIVILLPVFGIAIFCGVKQCSKISTRLLSLGHSVQVGHVACAFGQEIIVSLKHYKTTR